MAVAWTSVTGALLLLVLPGVVTGEVDLSSCDPTTLSNLPAVPAPMPTKTYTVYMSAVLLPNIASLSTEWTTAGDEYRTTTTATLDDGSVESMDHVSHRRSDSAGQVLVSEKDSFGAVVTERFLIVDKMANKIAAFLEVLDEGETTPEKYLIVYSQSDSPAEQSFMDRLQTLATSMCTESVDITNV